MELIFIDSIPTADGGFKYVEGEIKDYPRPTWQQIAKTVGRPLNSFAAPVADIANVRIKGEGAKDAAPKPRKKAKRVKLKAK